MKSASKSLLNGVAPTIVTAQSLGTTNLEKLMSCSYQMAQFF